MEPQTDGPEWVLASLFILGALIVVGAAVREVRALLRRDRDGEDAP